MQKYGVLFLLATSISRSFTKYLASLQSRLKMSTSVSIAKHYRLNSNIKQNQTISKEFILYLFCVCVLTQRVTPCSVLKYSLELLPSELKELETRVRVPGPLYELIPLNLIRFRWYVNVPMLRCEKDTLRTIQIQPLCTCMLVALKNCLVPVFHVWLITIRKQSSSLTISIKGAKNWIYACIFIMKSVVWT